MKTGNLMTAFACVLCLGLGAYENFDAAYKDAQRLQKENKDTEALTALQKAAALSQEDWQRYRVFSTAANIYLKTRKLEEAAKQVAVIQALSLDQDQKIEVNLLNAQVLIAQKKTADAAIRPDTVREKAEKNAEIRHRSVHGEKAGGQASCEFLAEYGEPLPLDGKTQVLPEKSPDAPQNVGVSDKMDGSLQKTEQEFLSERAAPERGYALGLHESKSEIDGRGGANLHESESENGAGSGNALHEGESEITEPLHETTSELAERVARELLDGLRRAAWVR